MEIPEINGKGYATGFVVWLTLFTIAVFASFCVKSGSCRPEDLFTGGFFAVATGVPAWLAAITVSSFFD